MWGGNTLLHMATIQPERIEAMVTVSATMYFPDQVRAIMQKLPTAGEQRPGCMEGDAESHKLGDEQIKALWDWMRGMKDSYDDMNFTPPSLCRIKASTLIVYGHRDSLSHGHSAVSGNPSVSIWVVPNGGHGPVFFDAAAQFAQTALAFL